MRLSSIVIIASLIMGCSPKEDVAKTEINEVKVKTPNSTVPTRPIIQRAPPNAKELANISGRVLSGKINGEKWSFLGGKAKKVGDKLQITLYDQVVEGCGEPENPHAPSIFLPDQKLVPGEGEFSFKIMAGFKYPGHSDFAVKGKWRLDSAGPKIVSGGFSVNYRKHFMNGKFSVPLCD